MKSDLPPPRLPRQILDEASTWFVEFRVGDVNHHARERFYLWLRQSPQHIRAYLEISSTYINLPSKSGQLKIDIEQLIARARAQDNLIPFDQRAHSDRLATIAAGEHGLGRVAPPPPQPRARPRALAAAILGTCVAASLLLWAASRPVTYTTQVGQRMSFALADGSTVDLNANSKVRIRFSKAERDVDLLEGQALFEVAKDKARPFVVRTGAALVRAVGTQFDVYSKLGGTTVTVVEGRVAVLPKESAATARSGGPVLGPLPPNATFVSAGETVVVTDRAVTEPKRTDVIAVTAWLQRRLIFEDSPLSEVVEQFNRGSRRQLVIEDSALDDFGISGVYSSTDPSSFIRFLQAQPDIRIVETDAEVRIGRR